MVDAKQFAVHNDETKCDTVDCSASGSCQHCVDGKRRESAWEIEDSDDDLEAGSRRPVIPSETTNGDETLARSLQLACPLQILGGCISGAWLSISNQVTGTA